MSTEEYEILTVKVYNHGGGARKAKKKMVKFRPLCDH